MKQQANLGATIKTISKVSLLLALVVPTYVFAADLQSIATTITTQLKTVADLLVVIAYVAGVGFCLAGVVQFKAHKDNPAQVPLSKPIVYLIVGACLLFLPTIMQVAGNTIFGAEEHVSGQGGEVGNL